MSMQYSLVHTKLCYVLGVFWMNSSRSERLSGNGRLRQVPARTIRIMNKTQVALGFVPKRCQPQSHTQYYFIFLHLLLFLIDSFLCIRFEVPLKTASERFALGIIPCVFPVWKCYTWMKLFLIACLFLCRFYEWIVDTSRCIPYLLRQVSIVLI